MKRLLSLLVLAAVMLTPILVRAEEQHPESTRSAPAVSGKSGAAGARPMLLRLAPGGARMSVGAAELKLDVAANRWGITMSLAL
jgi:hypothetical protein